MYSCCTSRFKVKGQASSSPSNPSVQSANAQPRVESHKEAKGFFLAPCRDTDPSLPAVLSSTRPSTRSPGTTRASSSFAVTQTELWPYGTWGAKASRYRQSPHMVRTRKHTHAQTHTQIHIYHHFLFFFCTPVQNFSLKKFIEVIIDLWRVMFSLACIIINITRAQKIPRLSYFIKESQQNLTWHFTQHGDIHFCTASATAITCGGRLILSLFKSHTRPVQNILVHYHKDLSHVSLLLLSRLKKKIEKKVLVHIAAYGSFFVLHHSLCLSY